MKESEIRPAALFERYLELSRHDIESFFADSAGFTEVVCPSCGSSEHSHAFTKLGFRYQLCEECGSMYVSPRPTATMQRDYALKSEAVKFWSTHFYRETAEARRAKIFRPRAELVRELASRGTYRPGTIADIGPGYGLFLEEVRQLNLFERIIGVEPVPGLAQVCADNGFDVVEKFVEDLDEGEVTADLTTAFEVIEHVFDPLRFLLSCRRTLRPGGLLLLTTLTISGFDLQVLWKDSRSIYPPHHINILSLDGLGELLRRAGFEVLEMTTPGSLDLEIVSNAVSADSSMEVPRFVRLLASRPTSVREDFQQFLQRANLSSHVRILAHRHEEEI